MSIVELDHRPRRGPDPLSQHVVLTSGDLDEARCRIGEVFVPHRIDVAGRGHTAVRLHAVQLNRVTFAYSRYGRPVEIGGFGAMDACYHVNVLQTGSVRSRRGRDEVFQSRRGEGVVFTPTEGWRMEWGDDCAQLAIRIDRQALETHMARMAGRAHSRPIDFDFALAGTPAVRSYLSLLDTILSELDARPASWLTSRLMIAQIEDFVMTGLLAAQPHDVSDAVDVPPAPSRPRHVKRAIDLMVERADEPIAMADLAAVAGVSARTLQAAFQSHVGMAPMQVLRDIRLERVHQELMDRDADTTVAAVALRWGFGHLGRFAASYRLKYGRSPSDTLRRCG